ncbi:MAG: lysine--tRNA ligase [Patescibacteria group bacterium]|nr:lysine--tRNA ligase [Patescibacteria group bacterium]
MFWADKLLEGRKGREWINDAWTPSGMIHMGGLKGPIIHDVLFRILKEQKKDAKYTFGFDDFDPIDGLPQELLKSHEKYMGVPIFMVPSPDGKGSFGDFFCSKMLKLFKDLGIAAEIYYASDYYKKGVYNDAIKLVLDNAENIRKVYEEIYKKKIALDWYPFQVICPKCGKLGTTKVVDWDGEKVTYICDKNLVKWAEGCGNTGKISPFGGNGKMPFKVEWAAKWWTFKVTIEGAGKDHASAGGTYDVAMKICRDIFKKDPPLKIPYEFFLSQGKKMASSKGVGLTGEDLLEVLSPQVVRFLMIKTPPNQAVEFSPRGTDLIPKLYDDYQRASDAYFKKTKDEQARAFELSQTEKLDRPPIIRFSVLAQWVQMPNMESEIKKEGLEKWAEYAKVWVEKYAPESEKFLVQKEIPDAVKELSQKQKEFLQKISSELDKKWDAEDFQKNIYECAKGLDMSSKDAFSAIYISLLGKDHGPKAGWLILSLDKTFVQKRFAEI